MQEVGASRHRSFCFQNFSLDPNVHIMEVVSSQEEKRRFSNNWTHLKRYSFPPFALIGQVLNKTQEEKATLLLITTAWHNHGIHGNTIMVFTTVTTYSANTIILPKTQNLLLGPNRENHSSIKQGNSESLALTISRKDYIQKEFWKTLLLLPQRPKDQVQMLIANRPGVSDIAGVLKDSLIPLSVL